MEQQLSPLGVVGATGALVGDTGAGVGRTGALVGDTGAGVGRIGALVGDTGAGVGLGRATGLLIGAFVGAATGLVGAGPVGAVGVASPGPRLAAQNSGMALLGGHVPPFSSQQFRRSSSLGHATASYLTGTLFQFKLLKLLQPASRTGSLKTPQLQS
jgi:hypothetical protein